MYRQTVPITNIQGVAAGQVATIDLPTNRRYHKIILFYEESGAAASQAAMEAAITDIKISLNSRVQREYSAAELFSMNASHGADYDPVAGVIPIYFSEPWLETPADQDSLAWALAGNGINSFQIEVSIASGRVSPALTGYAVIDYAAGPNGQPIPLQPIVTTRRRVIGVDAAGLRNIIDMPRNLGNYQALYCFEGAANDIEKLRVTIDQYIAWERTDAVNDAMLKQSGLVPQAGIFLAKFNDDNRMADGLPMTKAAGGLVSELSLDFTLANANGFTIVSEIIGGIS